VRCALHAEWTKLRTVAASGWLLLASIGLTVALGAAATAAVKYAATSSVEDTTKLSLTGIDLGQAIIAILAVLVISSEYSSRTITLTLAAMPRRLVVLAAKATILSALTVAAGTIAVLGSLLAGRLILPGNGFTSAHGYPTLSLARDPTLRAGAGSVLYLTLIALLSLGIATAVRDSAMAIGLVLGLLYLFPIVQQVVTDPDWQRHLKQIGPMTAGLAIQDTINLHNLPIGPWSGLGVLAAWAAAALLTGGLLLRLRDA
jgi:ABC-2 type transport system permease protein